MNKKQEERIRQFYRRACVLTAVAAIMLAILRTVLTPVAFEQSLPYGVSLVAVGVLLVALLTLSAFNYMPPIKAGGRMAQVSAAGAAVAGATFVIFSVVAAQQWSTRGIMPYPNKVSVTGLDELLVFLQIAAGLVGGAVLLVLAVQWWCTERMTRRCTPLLALVPVLWSWVRLIRYITSHVSSLGLFRNLYDLGMIIFEMLFFVLLARYLSGVGEKPSRFFFGVSLCAGLLCAIGCITQTALYVAQHQAAFDACSLVTAPDFGVALLAFSIAFSQGFGTVVVEDAQEALEDVPEQEGDGEDGEGAEYLLSDQWFGVHDSDEEDADD